MLYDLQVGREKIGFALSLLVTFIRVALYAPIPSLFLFSLYFLIFYGKNELLLNHINRVIGINLPHFYFYLLREIEETLFWEKKKVLKNNNSEQINKTLFLTKNYLEKNVQYLRCKCIKNKNFHIINIIIIKRKKHES